MSYVVAHVGDVVIHVVHLTVCEFDIEMMLLSTPIFNEIECEDEKLRLSTLNNLYAPPN